MEKHEQNSANKRRPKVAVVVGSGGIKALSTMALFKFLDEAKIKVDLLVGCSGGANVAANWACGVSGAQMESRATEYWSRDLFTKVDYRSLLSMANLPFGRFDKTSGLIKADRLKQRYIEVFGDKKIEDLHTETIFQTTDLLTGASVILTKGLVRDAVYASSALFPILPPINIDGQLLIDGAYSSPLPILEAIRHDMDVIITMTNEERSTKESKGFLGYFFRCLGYNQTWLTRNQLALSVNVHHHEIIFINVVYNRFLGLRATHRIPEILEAGAKAVEEKKGEIISAIESF